MGRFTGPSRPPDIQDVSAGIHFVNPNSFGERTPNLVNVRGGKSKVPSMSPQPKKTPAASPYPTWLQGLSDAQLQALAQQQANSQIGALRDPILAARKQAALNALGQRQEIVALGGALAQIEKGMAPDMMGVFTSGGQELRDIGGGLGDALAANVGGSQAANDAYVATMAPGSGPSGQAPNAAAEGAVVTGLAGTIPGDSFDAQGQAVSDFYNAMPGVEAASVREDYMSSLAQERAQDADYEQQLIQVAQQEPQLRAQALDALYNHELDKLNARQSIDKAATDKQTAAAALKQQQFENSLNIQDENLKARAQATQDRAERANEIALGIKSDQFDQTLKLQYAKLNAQQKTAIAKANAAGRQIDAAASRGAHKMIDQYGRPVLDAQGKEIPFIVPKPKGPASTPAAKAAKAAKARYGQSVSAARVIRGTPIENPNPGLIGGKGKYIAAPGAKGVFSMPDPTKPGHYIRTTNDPKKAAYDSKYDFNSALNYLQQAYPGLTKAQARKALIAAGWKPTGARPKK